MSLLVAAGLKWTFDTLKDGRGCKVSLPARLPGAMFLSHQGSLDLFFKPVIFTILPFSGLLPRRFPLVNRLGATRVVLGGYESTRYQRCVLGATDRNFLLS